MTKSALLFMAMFLVGAPVIAADLSGAWTLRWEPDFGGQLDAYDCTFKQNSQVLTVNCREDAVMKGEVDGQKVTIRFKTGRDGNENATLTGEVNQQANKITGEWRLSEQNRTGKFVATKQ
jgi:hypothetical protein